MTKRRPDMRDPSTDSLNLRDVVGSTHTTDPLLTVTDGALPAAALGLEADVILIAHPENRRLGHRFRLSPGGSLDIGRAPTAQVSLPEVPSLSRSHARLRFVGNRVVLEDLGSRNGTFVNDRQVQGGPVELKSGDRFQVGSVHFKFLHERDVEHAYHEAIYQMVMRDGLTEVYNQRKFQEEATREFARAQRHERPLALVLLDIDHFKQVNDTFGHLVGDRLLRAVAGSIRRVSREGDVLMRYGGEEFMVVVPGAGGHDLLELGERIRRAIAATEVSDGERRVTVTASVGGAAYPDHDVSSATELVEAADSALYASKHLGRDRVTLS